MALSAGSRGAFQILDRGRDGLDSPAGSGFKLMTQYPKTGSLESSLFVRLLCHRGLIRRCHEFTHCIHENRTAATPNPWVLSDRTLTVFYGCPEMPRLSHHFLPRLLFAKKQILYLDGATQISPLLLARFARERGVEPSTVNSLIRVARAFTCFQLTELVRRVPKTLERFSADVLIVTALPDLYFDDDVREREARASFEHALEGLRNVAPLSLSIAVFSDATSFKTKRRDFFQRLRTQADHVVKVESTPENKLSFTREKNTPLLSA